MSLTAKDFAQFNQQKARQFLSSFDARTRKKGEAYLLRGAVTALNCLNPGCHYTATVLGGDEYAVNLIYANNFWDADCSCPVGFQCKHTYAALAKLLAEHTAVTTGQAPPVAGKFIAKSVAPNSLAGLVGTKLERKLTDGENSYLRTINRLYRQANNQGLHYVNELTGLGIKPPINWWGHLELYPDVPDTELEFWNYLALYLTETEHLPIPPFLEPVTDLTKVREVMREVNQKKEIARWKQLLNNYSQVVSSPETFVSPAQAGLVTLRVRFTEKAIKLEWREATSEWTEIKSSKIQSFETYQAPRLSPDGALIWMAYWQRAQVFRNTQTNYLDPWVTEQISRWFRQTSLHPLLVNDLGAPLVFHPEPARWAVTEPDNENGNYQFNLEQANGEPLPAVWCVCSVHPVFYLTAGGVFTGPPLVPQAATDEPLQIPAAALESAQGLRFFEYLQATLPPRLAARVAIVTLRPVLRAELKQPFGKESGEYCTLKILGQSADGKITEYWTYTGWEPGKHNKAQSQANQFVRIDRSALPGFASHLEAAGFNWFYDRQSWLLKINKKFPDIFTTFLKTLPPDTRMELAGELALFKDAEISGKIRLEASEVETDWFDLRVIVDVSDTTLTPAEIKLLLDAKGKWVRLENKGWRKLAFTLSESEDQELARLGLTPHELTSEAQRLHAFQLADPAARKFLSEETCTRIERRAKELQTSVTPEIPAEIQAELRPYQRDGFHFLCYLSANRFGGILADDMGLGKTLQTLAWLAWLRREVGVKHKPSLVVCPKSVADNWHAEALKFFPTLKVRAWPASELKDFIKELATADLHVLNYSQFRQVGEALARESLQAAILDEGQYIKNPTSQTAQIARLLRAEHRLILSGTPIENRLLDLWSLMSFAMPGALGNRSQFGRLFDAKDDPFARQRLAARVRPFLIRRTKAQVARDLPDRIEEDLFCELEGEQKTLYRAELKRAQALLLGVKTAAALNKQRFNFLTSLLRLRQICCHARLVKPDSKADSAKLEALFETLEPLIEEGEKVLVFSQFVELLDILREELKTRGWAHWYLAGDTENRGALVKEFQAAEGAGVFLISLKAGGFGLNLTASSYVILFDPWWNPAVENQAIDRTHRIGQTRNVIAYRLLVKDSIEEKIRALQKKKNTLAQDVLGEEKFSQSLSLDDLRYLLS